MSDVQDIHGAIPQPKGVDLLRDEAGNYAIKAAQATDPAVRRMAQEREREFDAIADELQRLRSAPGETPAGSEIAKRIRLAASYVSMAREAGLHDLARDLEWLVSSVGEREGVLNGSATPTTVTTGSPAGGSTTPEEVHPATEAIRMVRDRFDNSEPIDFAETLGLRSLLDHALKLLAAPTNDLEALREALEEIVEREEWFDPHDYWGNGGEMECRYCWSHEHSESCPVVIARRALSKHGGEG